MCDFTKPKRINIDITLQKDLCEGEDICPTCKGLGIIVRDNQYGIKQDPDKRIRFPYTHQFLAFCPTCYDGVIKRCQFCGEIIPRIRTKCNCEKQRETVQQERERKEAEILKNAPEATPEILEKNDMFFSEAYSYNEGFFEEWEDFFEEWYQLSYGDENEKENRPKYVWTTEPVYMKMYAADIAYSATEDLYEDAYDQISDSAIEELQDYLNKWCDSCGVGTTYIQGKYKVKIPWEEYENDYC
jgi:hypothetical protein